MCIRDSIWGPPGTGKTTTISYLAPLLARRGERILIASHTNAAVDAVIRAAVKGFSPSEIERDVVVRIGSPSEQGSDIQHVTLDAIVEKRSVESVSYTHLLGHGEPNVGFTDGTTVVACRCK